VISSGSLSQSATGLLVPSSSLSSGGTTSGISTVLSPHSTSSVIPTGSSSSTSNAINGITHGTSNASFDTSHSSNLGSIIGGAIGALALIIFVMLIILFLRRRRNRSQEADALVEPFHGSSTVPSPLTYSSSQHTHDLGGYESTNNTNTSFSLSPTSLTQNHRIPPNDMIQVDNATPLLTVPHDYN